MKYPGMRSVFMLLFCCVTSCCFSQQQEEFRRVKDFYNHHRVMLNTEFRKKFDAETGTLNKISIKSDFQLFMRKMDSIENVALIGALLKVKNLEDLDRIRNKIPKSYSHVKVSSSTDQPADYPGGINALRQEVGRLFYAAGVYSEIKTVKANVAFIVERDGSISNVHAQGENFTFNRQAEIALYSLSEKFTPGHINGDPVRFRFQLPLTMNIED